MSIIVDFPEVESTYCNKRSPLRRGWRDRFNPR